MVTPKPDLETTYETDRLWLEPVRASHAGLLFATLSDPRLYRFIPTEPPASIEALAERYGRLESRHSPAGDELWLNWVMRRKLTNQGMGDCIGVVQATLRAVTSAYFAYELGVDHWHQGFATEACRRIVQALFEDFGVGSLEAEVDTRHVASSALLSRLGFVQAGFRANAAFFHGETSDEYRYLLQRPAPPGGSSMPQAGIPSD